MAVRRDFDLVVVGCGPAGSSAAAEAAALGARVAVIEREASVAETVRTSGVTWMRSVREFGIPDDCFNPVRNYSFRSPNNEVTVSDSAPRAAVLDVRKTYRWLARQAEARGAEIFLGTTATGAIRGAGGRVAGVTCTRGGRREDFHAGVVVDASGFPSVVCRDMGLAPRWGRFGAGAEVEARVENADPDTWWLMVGQRYSPAGYAWIFPVGGDTVRIGVGIGKPESAVDPAARLRELLGAGEGPIGGLGRVTPVEYHYGLIPNEGLTRRTVHDGLVLVGDSAGQANPLVLEGIRYAIRFGRVAGRVSAGAAMGGRTDSGALRPYEEAWKREILGKVRSAGRVQDRWIGLTDEQWDRELDVIRGMSPDEFLDFISADFGMAGMARLALRHPGLAARQLLGLVRGGWRGAGGGAPAGGG